MWPPLQLSEWADSCRPLPSFCAEPPSILSILVDWLTGWLVATALLLSALFTGLPACFCVSTDSHVVTDVHTSSRLEHLTCLLSSIFHPANELTLGLFRSVPSPRPSLMCPKVLCLAAACLNSDPRSHPHIILLCLFKGRVSFAVSCCDPAKGSVWENASPTSR